MEYQTKLKTRIFSFHWITCNSFLICQNGILTFFYFGNHIFIPISKFILPKSKERWTTCAVLVGDNIIVGDRKGSIHLFELGNPKSLRTLPKVHSCLGVANLVWKQDHLISLGRDGMMKSFMVQENNITLLTSDKLPFSCLLDVIDNFILGFTNDSFIVWDDINKRILFEQFCGSSHRSWDFYKKNSDGRFSFIKKSMVNTIRVNFDQFCYNDFIVGFHIDAINSTQVFSFKNGYILISGGEDTTLRITSLKSHKFESIAVLKSHLSNIRVISSYCINNNFLENKGEYLTFSAGGRGQIICWKIEISRRLEYFDVECTEEHSYYESLNKGYSEIRVMDLFIYEINKILTLFSACSNGNIKIFVITSNNGRYNLSFVKNIFYKLKCIMKLSIFNIFEKHILVSMATDGYLTFWDISDIFNINVNQPFGALNVHQSGINSYSSVILENNNVLFLTGGDDNAIALSLVKFEVEENNIFFKCLSQFIDTGTHCAQVTGIYLGTQYFLSSSIDQKIAIFSWKIEKKSVICELVAKYSTSITDIKGVKCFETSYGLNTFLYGNGIEFLKIII